MKRLLIIEDQAILSDLIAKMIDEIDGIDLAGRAADGKTGLAQFEALEPDVVLLDIGLPGMNGIDILKKIKASKKPAFTIVFTGWKNRETICDAFREGADSFLEKTVGLEELEKVLSMAAQDQPTYSEAAMDAIQDILDHPDTENPLVILTQPEIEVLRLIGKRKTVKEIADTLGWSHPQVINHRWNLMRKLDLHDNRTLAAFAAEQGLTE